MTVRELINICVWKAISLYPWGILIISLSFPNKIKIFTGASVSVWALGTFRLDLVCYSHHSSPAAAKSLQLCPTLCDPRDGSPLGSSVPEILQARTLEWVAISFSNAWKWKVKVKSLSRALLLVTPWTGAYQEPTLLAPWDFPGKSTGVECHCLLRIPLLHCAYLVPHADCPEPPRTDPWIYF